MSQLIGRIYEFGHFRLDTTEQLLLRDGEVISLPPKAFDVLLVLVAHHGHLLGKEELLKLVWPDAFVEEANLSYNISLIRKALSSGENGQKFIETIPKRGYRFVANVQELKGDGDLRPELLAPTGSGMAAGGESAAGGEPQIIVTTGAAPPLNSFRRQRRVAALALAVLVMASGGIAFWLSERSRQKQLRSDGTEPLSGTVPVTSFPGYERQPAFSPDGNQIAFVWDGEREDNVDIYVKLIGAGEPLRLTSNPAPDLNPVWSPDGRHIAFTREGEGSGIYLVPALGGTERKLSEIFPERPFHKLSLSYSPGGEWLAIADKDSAAEPFSISLFSVGMGEKRRLTHPPGGSLGDVSPAFSPDGKLLAFARTLAAGVKDIYVVPVSGGEPKRLTFDDTMAEGLTWTMGGSEIVFSSRRGGSIFHLWRVPVSGGNPERVAVFAQEIYYPAISRQGNRLAWTQVQDDANIWRAELQGTPARAAAPVKLIASTTADDNPQYSPDGEKIVFASNRSGASEIWVTDRDGKNPLQLTNIGAPDTGTPRWSPDGRQVAFDGLLGGNRDVYVVSSQGGEVRRLTEEPSEDMCPSWSRDGQWIYFGSSRSGSLQIWKMPAEGG
ncbi:MAG: winged helix-turn-helix domain-containing protein, partial [Pseudomonadota bacterium]|nr:winged helix-turn-helix domain-containing protein [Pseudomonadota bacterium]